MTKKTHNKKYATDHYNAEKRRRELEWHIKRTSRVARCRATITTYQINAAEILKEKWIIVEIEKAIKYKSSFFLIDIFVPEYNMCIEIDWEYHDNPEVSKADKIRDDYLKSQWYWVFRVRNSQVKSWFYQIFKRSLKTRENIIKNIEKNKILA